jgi:hypothetical protein
MGFHIKPSEERAVIDGKRMVILIKVASGGGDGGTFALSVLVQGATMMDDGW